MLGSPQEITRTLPNADLSVSFIGNEYWERDSSVLDGRISQTAHETDETPALILSPSEGGNIELSSENFARDVRSVKYDASSELSRHFACTTGQENFQPHSAAGSGSVEIKVEVDPNLYVTCGDTQTDKSQSDCHLKNSQYNKPSVVLLPETHSKVNSNQNVCIKDSGTRNVDITINRLIVGNKQDQIADNINLKQFVKDELDNKWKSVNIDDSGEDEASESSDGDSEFCTEEASESYDLVRNCSPEEQMDLQLSQFYKFECDECPIKQTFSTFKVLVQHCRDEHQSRGCVSCCDQRMWERDELVGHMCNHKHTYRCLECQEVFTNQSAWKDHLKQHSPKTDVDPFLCPHCNKQFSSKYGLANHMNLHLPESERPYKCQYCNKGFGAKHAMTKHERTHLPDEERLSYVCDVCGKRFGYASTLDGHQRHVHQNERPFVCHICAKSFPIKGALTYHLTTHEVQDRVQCTQCGIWLKNEKILRIHKKCHEGELFTCPHCDKVSSTRNNLRMHMKRHSDARPHTCPLCTRAFKTPRDLKVSFICAQ
ncbi:hypothetical protein B7P43_G11606 [Cryptotermes secundus]|uniref:C2H2-type domain-containing protein n=1 Tax=Cryptotermes secundus TaxID=105785 RepID=A0A2J7RBR2_9NEOP|nr:hypothetical protein B7P43_G11606 [Cryptotermes secundus]